MAAAPVIPPHEDFDSPLTITITNAGVAASQEALTIDNGQPVTFTNPLTFPVTISFVADPVNTGEALFTNVSLTAATLPPNPGSTKSQTPNPSYPNRTVNYHVSINGNPGLGPFAIQVGIPGPSPFFIAVNNNNTTPDAVRIPTNGWIEMVAMDGNTYDISGWSPSDPFDPPINQINPGIANNSPSQDCVEVSAVYTFNMAPQDFARGGGGTIKVGGT